MKENIIKTFLFPSFAHLIQTPFKHITHSSVIEKQGHNTLKQHIDKEN